MCLRSVGSYRFTLLLIMVGMVVQQLYTPPTARWSGPDSECKQPANKPAQALEVKPEVPEDKGGISM